MNDSHLVSILNSFESIDLDSMSGVSLMNRYETKYLLSSNKIEMLISLLAGKYKVLEIDSLRILPYTTIYLDTPDYLFYNQHVRGELARHKIRYRKYISTNISFLEIKKKSNKGKTLKWRIENNFTANSFDEAASLFIGNRLPGNQLVLNPVLENSFTRLTLVGLDSKERITMDYNLLYSEPDKGDKIEIPFLAVVEVKKESKYEKSYFTDTIKKIGIHPTGFSKYCYGSAMLNDQLKRNILKAKFLLINKIENEYLRTHRN